MSQRCLTRNTWDHSPPPLPSLLYTLVFTLYLKLQTYKRKNSILHAKIVVLYFLYQYSTSYSAQFVLLVAVPIFERSSSPILQGEMLVILQIVPQLEEYGKNSISLFDIVFTRRILAKYDFCIQVLFFLSDVVLGQRIHFLGDPMLSRYSTGHRWC